MMICGIDDDPTDKCVLLASESNYDEDDSLGMTGSRILLIEDEHIVSMDLCSRLEKLGYEIVAMLASGERATTMDGLDRVDLALVDITLAGPMDGIETAHILWKKYRIPSIFITAYGDAETLDRAKKVEPYGYLLKPVREFELAATLELAQYRLRAEQARREARELRLKLERNLQNCRKMDAVGRLAAGAAHDLNNTLTGVLGHLGLLKLDSRIQGESRESVDLAHQGIEDASKAVSELLGFAGKAGFVRENIDLAFLLQDTISFLQTTTSSGLEILFSANDDSFLIFADATQVRRVVTNIILNAEDALSGEGILEIKLYKRSVEQCDLKNTEAAPGRYTVAHFEDDGDGIPSELLEKIFEPFFSTKSEQGLGMGLAMAYGVMQQSGGWIEARNASRGGAIFELYFPEVR